MEVEHTLAESEDVFRAVIAGGGTFTLYPRGDSMRPTIVPGRDRVSIVHLEGRAALHDVLFYKRPNGKFVIHRVIAVGEQDYTLCGDNQVQKERGVQDDWIIGVVTEIHRPDGVLVRGTPAFERAARRRRLSRPLRWVRRRASLLYHRLRGK